MPTRTRAPLTSGGLLWGTQRVAAGISVRQLEERSGVSRGLISLMERGRFIPDVDQYAAITSALAAIIAERSKEVHP